LLKAGGQIAEKLQPDLVNQSAAAAMLYARETGDEE